MTFVMLLACVAFLSALLALARVFWPKNVLVQPFQRGVLTSRGTFERVVEPGLYWVPKWKMLTVVDTRLQVLLVNGQEVFTEDGISVKLSLSGEYAVTDAERYLYATAQPANSLHLYAQAAIRELVSATGFDGLLKVRAGLDAELLALVKPQAERVGVRLEKLIIRDVMLPGEVKRALAAQMTAQKEGLAALERTRGETASLRNLANAARLMEGNPALIQLRALQTMESSKGNTLVLGVAQGPVLKSTPEPM